MVGRPAPAALRGVGNIKDDPAKDHRVDPDSFGELLLLEAGDVNEEKPR